MEQLFEQNGESALGLSLEDGLEYTLRKKRASHYISTVRHDEQIKSMKIRGGADNY